MRLRKVKDALVRVQDSPYFSNPEQLSTIESESLFVEIGCGKSWFLSQQAQQNPKCFFVGIEREPTIVLKAINKVNRLEVKPRNLLITCLDANQLTEYLKPQSISKIFINFPDPWPKKRHTLRRLTAPHFLKQFHQLLKKQGLIEFKTDNDQLFEFTLEVLQKTVAHFKIIEQTTDLHNSPLTSTNIMTEYEQRFVSLGVKIKKLTLEKLN
ncbi:tRNA (guanosine(46)-N7)-methyltransferase TrmB [Mycoplasmoides pneumoniae]|uniref:tRNA (guanine-N(7)-)-methyltransferase n=1 Tax=Mycoplasma pneumoniae (strain ATCC 29342 / M129 / Subtype 1) TaxID=272634 RepID=TRMB_MYCPN|nr:tRNA (guanosine(46)-N7)-methyltransferase TrmB [Mycoplasmoides pneumoniae]P75256.1 RecName: Full=tRNA (guanine-N(7)-)-methyltransferase; AltName: Full=tRNA (guanine(46)-N(7))-methyltransferase; AltName: Full=tRNA(m7G46)-methyltransferase [Mycoplasmoides pneumoniae M129]AAB95968.1 methyltransferase-like protein [Mycoplasmoides pneumoniae M129]AGC04408.1 tRNA (guanine-N7)-methyltransferase [Mycoplasmoides pneumoniae M129-B7]ALA30396.1 tRNA (guanine-N7)-methyltransferase [Mycoplasmoides pneumon